MSLRGEITTDITDIKKKPLENIMNILYIPTNWMIYKKWINLYKHIIFQD